MHQKKKEADKASYHNFNMYTLDKDKKKLESAVWNIFSESIMHHTYYIKKW